MMMHNNTKFVCSRFDDSPSNSGGRDLPARSDLYDKVRALFKNYPLGGFGTGVEILEDEKLVEAERIFERIRPEIENDLSRRFGFLPQLNLVAVRQDFMNGAPMDYAAQLLLEIRSSTGELLVPSRLKIDGLCAFTPVQCQGGFLGLAVKYFPKQLISASAKGQRNYEYNFFFNQELFQFLKSESAREEALPLIIATLKENLRETMKPQGNLHIDSQQIYEVRVGVLPVDTDHEPSEYINYLVNHRSLGFFNQITLAWKYGAMMVRHSLVFSPMDSNEKTLRPSIRNSGEDEVKVESRFSWESWQGGMLYKFGSKVQKLNVELPDEFLNQLFKQANDQKFVVRGANYTLEVDKNVVMLEGDRDGETYVFVGFALIDDYGAHLMPDPSLDIGVGNVESQLIARVKVSPEVLKVANQGEHLMESLKSIPEGNLTLWGVFPGRQWIEYEVNLLANNNPGSLTVQVAHRLFGNIDSTVAPEQMADVRFYPAEAVDRHGNDFCLARFADGSYRLIEITQSGFYSLDGSAVKIRDEYNAPTTFHFHFLEDI